MPPGVWHDGGAYLLLVKSLADGEGLRSSQIPGSLPGTKFPPLSPLFLSLLWRIASEAVGQGPLASLFNVLFLASSGGLFVAKCSDHGDPPLVASGSVVTGFGASF